MEKFIVDRLNQQINQKQVETPIPDTPLPKKRSNSILDLNELKVALSELAEGIIQLRIDLENTNKRLSSLEDKVNTKLLMKALRKKWKSPISLIKY